MLSGLGTDAVSILISFLRIPKRAKAAERMMRRTRARTDRLTSPMVEVILAERGRSRTVRLLSWTTSP